MSIEKALADLTAALTANTAALASIKGAAAANASTKPPATTPKPASTKPKTKTDDEMRAAFGGYLSSGDAAAKTERKANITTILTHYDVKLVTEIPAEKRDDALTDLAKFQAGENPDWLAPEADADDGDDMLG